LGGDLDRIDLGEAYIYSDFFNQLYKIKICGILYLDPILKSYGEKKVVCSLSQKSIFFVGYPYIKIYNPGSSNFPGDIHNIKWTQYGPVVSVKITVVPIIHRGDQNFVSIVVDNLVVPKQSGFLYANEGEYDWHIPDNFYPDNDDRRFEYTVIGYDLSGQEIYRDTSSVFTVAKSGNVKPTPVIPEDLDPIDDSFYSPDYYYQLINNRGADSKLSDETKEVNKEVKTDAYDDFITKSDDTKKSVNIEQPDKEISLVPDNLNIKEQKDIIVPDLNKNILSDVNVVVESLSANDLDNKSLDIKMNDKDDTLDVEKDLEIDVVSASSSDVVVSGEQKIEMVEMNDDFEDAPLSHVLKNFFSSIASFFRNLFS
ncbi:MAG: hypothetical protein WA057_06760, partial [Candidatus Magasanikiibacteriota bacterium]